MPLPTIAAEAQRSSTPARPSAIRIHDLSKRFAVRRRWVDALRRPRDRHYTAALDQVSLEVGEGEIVGLLGVNGAGKTTLLKILSTLITPDTGTAEVGGFDVVRAAPNVRRLLAPVTADERSLDWRLNARENLRFFAALHGLRGASLPSRINEVLALVELADTGHKLVGAFSTGMRQRLMVARALCARPRVLLLDEPTRSLDPLAARAFRTFLRAVVARVHGCSILLATHNADEALELCDRVAVLHRGRLLAVGTPTNLAAQFGDQRYRIWTRTPQHRAFSRLRLAQSPVPDVVQDAHVLEITLPAGTDAAGEVLKALLRDGAHVSRFEKIQPSLADLIERIVDPSAVRVHA